MRPMVQVLVAAAIVPWIAAGCFDNVRPSRCKEGGFRDSQGNCPSADLTLFSPDGATIDLDMAVPPGVDLSQLPGQKEDLTVLDLSRADLTLLPDLAPYCTSGSCLAKDVTRPICVPTSGCQACTQDPQCKTEYPDRPYCDTDTKTGQCWACRKGTCAGTTPICDVNGHICRPCRAHSECDSGVCVLDPGQPQPQGACVDPSKIIRVDINDLNGCIDDIGAKPFCHLKNAVEKAPADSYLLVEAATTEYEAATINDKSLTLVGHGTTPPRVHFNDLPAITVSGTASVVVDGFDLRGSNPAKGDKTATAGVYCSANTGAATLTLRRCRIHDSGLVGISSADCNLVLDANEVSSNGKGGLDIKSGTQSISNNLIANNSGAPAITLSGSIPDSAIFWFNTVVNNQAMGDLGGLKCGGTGPTFKYGIIRGNTKMGGISVEAACKLMHSNLDEASGGSEIFSDDPKLDANSRATASSACSFTTPPPLSIANHDIDGKGRPVDGKYDCGASQSGIQKTRRRVTPAPVGDAAGTTATLCSP